MSNQLMLIASHCNSSRFVGSFNEGEIVSYFLDVAKQYPDFNVSVTGIDQHSVMFVNNEMPVSPTYPGYDAAVGDYPGIEFCRDLPDEYRLGAYLSNGDSIVICNADAIVTRALLVKDPHIAHLALFLYHTAKTFNYRFEMWLKHNVQIDLSLVSHFDLACFVAAKLPSDELVTGNIIYDILNSDAVKAVRDVLESPYGLKHLRPKASKSKKVVKEVIPQPVYIGGGYKNMPADNPYVTNGNTLGGGFHQEFMATNPGIVVAISGYAHDVNVSINHQPDYINRDIVSEYVVNEEDETFIIYIRPGSNVEIAGLLKEGLVRFVPGKQVIRRHYGDFIVMSDLTVFKKVKRYEVYWAPGNGDDFNNALETIANCHLFAPQMGRHLLHLLNSNLKSFRPYQVKQLYLAFNAIEVMTGKPFHHQEWLRPFLSDMWFEAVMLRHNLDFPL